MSTGHTRVQGTCFPGIPYRIRTLIDRRRAAAHSTAASLPFRIVAEQNTAVRPPLQAAFLHCDLTVTEPQHNIEAVTEMDTQYINKRGGAWHILLSKNLCVDSGSFCQSALRFNPTLETPRK